MSKMIINKKATTRMPLLMQTTMFIILNLIFFVGMLYMVNDAGSRSFIFEQSYAKEIALIIDNAKPETVVLLDVSEMVAFANDKKIPLDNIFNVDNEKNLVRVGLSVQTGYSFKYFTDADVELKLEGNMLSIVVKEAKNEV